MPHLTRLVFFFFNDTATTEIYTLSLHDALPIWHPLRRRELHVARREVVQQHVARHVDRKSTRLNSSHQARSYAVFGLNKKKPVQELVAAVCELDAEILTVSRRRSLSSRRAIPSTTSSLSVRTRSPSSLFFFFNDTATTEIYTLSLHDALPICARPPARRACAGGGAAASGTRRRA